MKLFQLVQFRFGLLQARSQVSRLVEHSKFLGWQDFRFSYMFETNFSGRNKIWGALPPNAPRGYGPGLLEFAQIFIIHANLNDTLPKCPDGSNCTLV